MLVTTSKATSDNAFCQSALDLASFGLPTETDFFFYLPTLFLGWEMKSIMVDRGIFVGLLALLNLGLFSPPWGQDCFKGVERGQTAALRL